MERIKVTSDSSCSLPVELLNKYGVDVVRLEIRTGEYIFQDMTEISGDNLFEYHDWTGEFVEGIPVPAEAFGSFFEKLAEEYDHVIHIGSSVGSDRSYQNAMAAAKAYPNVTVLDSGQVSSGMGLLVLCAAVQVQKGAPAEEILEKLNRCRRKLYAGFLIGTMEYFYQSERCTNFARRFTSLFHMRPGIIVVNNRLRAAKMYRGSDEAVREAYIADFIKKIPMMDGEILILAYSGCKAVFLERLYDQIAKLNYFDKIMVLKDSAAISSHCGPNTFGMYCLYREEPKGRGGFEDFSVGRGRRHI